MDALPSFRLVTPGTVEEAVALRAEPNSELLGGGTDLMVNIRRGIGDDPKTLIATHELTELRQVMIHDGRFAIGASVTLAELARHDQVFASLPALASAAGEVAGPTQRTMGTVGGNLCLDTRCIYYNQSEWWRTSLGYCLKYQGTTCHVAPGSHLCYATFSGDLAPVLMVLGAEVEIASARGRRHVPLAELYTGNGEVFLALAKDEMVCGVSGDLPVSAVRMAYEKVRVRQSIDYPVAGVAMALRRDGNDVADVRVGFTGTNPKPLLLEGCESLIGMPLDEAWLERLDALARKQVMALKTTFTSGHYRRRVACKLAARMAVKLYGAEND